LGTAITERVLDIAKKHGLRRISLEVIEPNRAAVRLYEKVGFKIEGRLIESFFGIDGKYYDSLIMGKMLNEEA